MSRKKILIATASLAAAAALFAGGHLAYEQFRDRDLPIGQEHSDVSEGADESAQKASLEQAKIDPTAPLDDDAAEDVLEQVAAIELVNTPDSQSEYFTKFDVVSDELYRETGKVLFAVVPVSDVGWSMAVGSDAAGNTLMWGAETHEEAEALLSEMLSTGWGDAPPPMYTAIVPSE